MEKEIIDFATWYSGMERKKVERAYQRYLREEKPYSDTEANDNKHAVIKSVQTQYCNCERCTGLKKESYYEDET